MSEPGGASPRDEIEWEMDDDTVPSTSTKADEDGGKSAHVRALEDKLKAPDAIMEPDILEVATEYLRSATYSDTTARAADVVRFLEGGYEGYAHMGSLVCSWLRFVDEDNEDDVDNENGENDEADDEGRGAKRHLLLVDEASFLRELVLEKFKPSTFENLFTTGGKGPPRWLNALVSEEGGRELVYQLSTKHDDSLLLSFALKKIVSNGFGDEVAGKGVDLSQYFDVFHSILMVRLRKLASTNDETEITRLCGLIQHSALSSVLGYVHVRQVLTRLAADGDAAGKPWSCRFRRMYQDLETASKDGLACKMSRFFVPDGGGGGDRGGEDVAFVTAAVVGDVLATSAGGHVAPTSDVIKLQRLYLGIDVDRADGTIGAVGANGCDERENGVSNRQIPSVTLLHHPAIVEVLLRSLFNPSKKLRGDALEAHAFVLSVAVRGVDASTSAGADADTDTVSFAEHPRVKELIRIIRMAVSLGYKATEDTVLTAEERAQVDESMAEGICATGVILLLRRKLTSSEYWGSAYHVHKEPPFLSLLFSIVEQQPRMRTDVLSLIKDAMHTAGNSTAGTDIVVALVRVLVELCKTDLVENILSWAVGWARNANAEVSRALILGLLEIAAPPYSDVFAEGVLRLMHAADLRRQSMGARLWNQNMGVVREFCDSAAVSAVADRLDRGDRGVANYLRDLKQAL